MHARELTGALARTARSATARRSEPIAVNLYARVAALVSLSVASLLVARTAGAAGVGILVLLRVLPWLTGLLLSCGVYGAAPYFLSGPQSAESGYRATLPAMSVAAGVLGSVAWVLAAPFVGRHFFHGLSLGLVTLAGVSVMTQLLESTAKACSQGFGDLGGSNRIIVLEEFLFVPIYGAIVAAGVPTYTAMVVALPLGDLLNSSQGWLRLYRRGYFRDIRRPTLGLARRLASFGLRAEIGSIVLLLNARFDFAVVGALVGPTALGIYAIASRYAELLRLPSLAMNYVLYPAYAKDGVAASSRARAAIPRMGWVPVAAAVPMAVAAPTVLPLVYGRAFHSATVPALILLVGLCGGGVTGVVSAFLQGNNRPGLNSAAMGAGLVVTLCLDFLLIPHFGVRGAASASTAAYLTTTVVLMACFHAVTRASKGTDGEPANLAGSMAGVSG